MVGRLGTLGRRQLRVGHCSKHQHVDSSRIPENGTGMSMVRANNEKSY